MKGYAPDDELEFDPRKLLIRAHEEELTRTYHRKMDQVLGHADIALFDAHQSVKEANLHQAIVSYGNAYRCLSELQSMLDSTIRQLVDYKSAGVYDKPFKPQI